MTCFPYGFQTPMLMSPTTLKIFFFHSFWIIAANPPIFLTIPNRPPYDIPHFSSHSDAVLSSSPETIALFFNKKLRAASSTKKDADSNVLSTESPVRILNKSFLPVLCKKASKIGCVKFHSVGTFTHQQLITSTVANVSWHITLQMQRALTNHF